MMHSPDRKATITSIVNESLEQFRNTLSQEHVRTVDLVKHWAKVASESKRVCTQIEEKLKGSDPSTLYGSEFCTVPAAEAMLREGLREAVAGLRSEFQGSFDSLENSILSKAIAAISSDAKSSVQKEAAAALDKVLEVEGRTLEAWTREFDFARSELSRQAGQLSSLEARLTRRSCEDELPQQTRFLGASGCQGEGDGNSASLDVCSQTPRSEREQFSHRASAQNWDEMGDQLHALGTRLACVEGNLASILDRSDRQSTVEALLQRDLEELRVRIQTLVPSEMEAALERLQELQEPSIALRQQLERMVEDSKDMWLREMASREEGEYRAGTACEHKLTNLEMALLELTRKIQDQAMQLADVEKAVSDEQAQRDEKQQEFSDAVQTTLKMLIEKMDEMSNGSAQLYSPAPPPPPFPIRHRSSEAIIPPSVLGNAVVTNIRRITSAPSYHASGISALARSSSDSALRTATLVRSSSDKLFQASEAPNELDGNHQLEQSASGLIVSSTSSTSVPGTPDVALSGGGGTVSSVPCTEAAVHTVGIPEDEPVLWAPRASSSTSARFRSLSPVFASSKSQVSVAEDVRGSVTRSPLGYSTRGVPAVSDEPVTQSSMLRRMVSLSPGRMSRSPLGSHLVPVGTSAPWVSSRSVPTARSTSPAMGMSSGSAETRLRSSSPTISRTRPRSPPVRSPPSAIHSASSSASAPVGVTLGSPLTPNFHEGSLRARSGTARFSAGVPVSAASSATAPPTVTRVTSSPSRNSVISSTLPCGIPSAILGPSRNSAEVRSGGQSGRQSLSPSPMRQRDTAVMPANVTAILMPVVQSSQH
mmetsp:Transcript_33792/g.53727  ORF Transcript_33792/g.53727 Transcript_33792/m.53727 type:complete len:821 (+) Transcript_33792:72-2534(+)